MSIDHGIATSTGEQRKRDFDLHEPSVVEGGAPAVPAGLTLAAFATSGYVASAVGNQLTFVQQDAVVLTIPDVDGLHWVALDESTTIAHGSGWTRPTFGAHYIVIQSATEPMILSGMAICVTIPPRDTWSRAERGWEKPIWARAGC